MTRRRGRAPRGGAAARVGRRRDARAGKRLEILRTLADCTCARAATTSRSPRSSACSRSIPRGSKRAPSSRDALRAQRPARTRDRRVRPHPAVEPSNAIDAGQARNRAHQRRAGGARAARLRAGSGIGARRARRSVCATPRRSITSVVPTPRRRSARRRRRESASGDDGRSRAFPGRGGPARDGGRPLRGRGALLPPGDRSGARRRRRPTRAREGARPLRPVRPGRDRVRAGDRSVAAQRGGVARPRALAAAGRQARRR